VYRARLFRYFLLGAQFAIIAAPRLCEIPLRLRRIPASNRDGSTVDRFDRAGKRPVINFLRTGVTASSEPRLDEEVASRENNQLMEKRAQSFVPAVTSQRSTEGAIYYSSYFSTAHPPPPPSVSVSAGYFDRADNVSGETSEYFVQRFALSVRRVPAADP